MECAEKASEHKPDQEIDAFESRIDNLHLNLELLKYPKNLALWSLVTNGLERLYQAQNIQVPERDRTLQTVLSRSFGVFLRKVADHPFKGHVAIKNLRLDAVVRKAAVQANEYARFWFAATGYFPEWHQKEVSAPITGLLDENVRPSALLEDLSDMLRTQRPFPSKPVKNFTKSRVYCLLVSARKPGGLGARNGSAALYVFML